MAKNWYILQVITNYEDKVKNEIERLKNEGKEGASIGDVKVPKEDVIEMKDGKQKKKKVKFLPGYVLIEIDIPDDPVKWKKLLSKLLSINGLSGFLGTTSKNDKPKPTPNEEVKSILQKMGELRTPDIIIPKVNLSLGEHVKIIDGAFNNFSGVVEDILHERGKAKVKVEIFGRSTLVEMDYEQLERLK